MTLLILRVILIAVPLLVIVAISWVFLSVHAHQHAREEAGLAHMRQQAERIGQALSKNAGDGHLSAREIEEVVDRQWWHAEVIPGHARVVVRIDDTSGLGDRCFTYEIPLPSRGASRATEGTVCPEATPHMRTRP
ncbi:hypothetical protein [Nonomuraea roseoviolacea]|uniref:Uncharacterized protein n=1 Tax=Nonomuraea roseoviolacea subsp. carminata TaxID=160689 RepID=A0ABT1K917_9ACTN|nr:hypothetical protein [Nonomuraea roseoviolacea]MCP2350498.1 hypothetical protein [Nonomuraea roseoviolacea subsp. carminata]